MKKYVILLVCVCWSLTVFGQKFSVKPTQPAPGKEITLTFDPAGSELEGAEEIEAVAYVFTPKKDIYDDDYLQAYDVPLKKGKNGWEGKVKPVPEATAVYFKFAQNTTTDNNKGEGYYVLMYGKDKKTLPAAQLAVAEMVGLRGYMLGLDTDPEKALPLYEKELTTYPQLKRPYLDQYTRILASTKDKDKSGFVMQELEWLEQQPKLSSGELEFLAAMFTSRKETEKATKYSEQLLSLDPKSRFFRNKRFGEVQQEQEMAKKEELLKALATDYPADATVAYFYSNLASSYAKENNVDAFRNLLENHPAANTQRVFQAFADALIASGENLTVAEEFAAKAYAAAKKELDMPTTTRASSTSEKEWYKSRKYMLGMTANTFANLYLKQENPQKALPYLKEAYDYTNMNSNTVIESYADVLQKTGNYKLAQDIMEGRVAEAKGTAKMKDLLKEGYVKRNNSEAGFDQYWAKVEAPAIEHIKKSLQKKIIKQAAPAFELADLNGNKVSLASLKGKTVVVDFWATWCGPCVAAFPSMQTAVDKYKSDSDVVFLFVNTWESGEDKQKKAGDFIAKKEYTFQVLMDAEDKVVKDFKVDGIPTKFIIDKEGNIRFKSVGYNGNSDLSVKELSMMIEMARQEQAYGSLSR